MDAAGFISDGGGAAPLPDGAVLAELGSYHELLAALRARADELKFSGKSLDAISGLADGYFQKLIGPIPQRTLGPGMLDAVLGTLCVRLVVIHDAEALEGLRQRLASPVPGSPLDGVVERDETRVRKPPSVVTFTSRTFQAIGRKGGAARREALSPERRAEIARSAALTRWAQMSPEDRHNHAKQLRACRGKHVGRGRRKIVMSADERV